MGTGKIICCWRNAPDNPQPGPDSWHPGVRDDRIPNPGNYLRIQEADGSTVLYAHAQPGSIPSSLCPNNAEFISKPNEWVVPADHQRTVRAGDFLFRTGNSGQSGGPHLHVHKQENGTPIQMQFRRGLYTPLSGPDENEADINKWTSFAGQGIPEGPILIWPPRRLTSEYARHMVRAADYKRLFDHLVDSGYWLEWIDGYSVSGKPFLNFVWRPAQGSWRHFFLLPSSEYQQRINQAEVEKYFPVQVESSLVNDEPRYTVTFVKNKPGKYLWRHNCTLEQHDALLEEAKRMNLRPVNISVVSIRGNLRYTVLYRSEDIGSWTIKSRVTESDYQALHDERDRAGQHPLYVNAYKHNGAIHYSVIFSEKPVVPPKDRKDRHGMTAQEYQSEWNSAVESGLLTRAVSGCDGAAQNHIYIAMWRK
jgi:murein DD-endopeptidase MepM/ murein hydrolase activator NlpD